MLIVNLIYIAFGTLYLFIVMVQTRDNTEAENRRDKGSHIVLSLTGFLLMIVPTIIKEIR